MTEMAPDDPPFEVTNAGGDWWDFRCYPLAGGEISGSILGPSREEAIEKLKKQFPGAKFA